jgi:Rrf2 family protein
MMFLISFVVNKRETYLVEALLVLAESYPHSLKVAEIARRRGAPTAFLARLLAGAARRGVVATARGPRGGVRLLRPPSSTALSEVLDEPVGSAARSPATAWLAVRLSEARSRVLAGITLSELLAMERDTEALIWNI